MFIGSMKMQMAKEPKHLNLMMQNKKIEEQREILLGEQREHNIQNLNINFLEDSTRKAKFRQVERDVEAALQKRSQMLSQKRLRWVKAVQLIYSQVVLRRNVTCKC